MYVQKFEAETLEEALKMVKRELGPDAVILKTVTNKGLKGVLKKSRVEITAAISEQTYLKKAKVDAVLNEDQKKEFYNSSATQIKRAIDKHNDSDQRTRASSNNGYGNLGLNRAVQIAKNEDEESNQPPTKKRASLDDFLAKRPPESNERKALHQYIEESTPAEAVRERPSAPVVNVGSEDAERRIDELERKLFELTRNVERTHKPEPIGLYQLRTTLSTLDINEVYIQKLIRKASFELNEETLQNPEAVFEFALQEMSSVVHVGDAKFAKTEEGTPVVTMLLSETSSGQTSMLLKLGALKRGSVLIQGSNNRDSTKSFAEKIFGIDVIRVNNNAEMIAECRKAVEKGQSVFVDYRPNRNDVDETKKMVDAIRRSFGRVEILITLSAIHSELYNRNMLTRYHKMSDGMLVSHLDICVSFGNLFNIIEAYPEVPFKFFGTGDVVPDDIESSTAERILAGMFELK